jgi:phosphate transport system substrate-binding protein
MPESIVLSVLVRYSFFIPSFTFMLRITYLLTPLFVVLAALTACGPTRTKDGKEVDTPTSGKIYIGVDEVAKPIIRSTVVTFEDSYPEAKIVSLNIPQEIGFQYLLKDSVRLVVGSRKLTDAEKAVFAERKITPHEYEYAHDAVAVIVHPSNADTLMTLDRLKGILAGESQTWPGRKNLKIVPVLESGSGANVAFLKERLHLPETMSANLFATGSTEKVIEYVAKTPGAIGFVGVGYLADTDSKEARAFLQTVRVVSISEASVATDENSFAPYQAYIQLKQYPLARMLYIVSGEPRSGLGTGFSAWAMSEKGQRIVLKAGLLPATMPVRLVQLNTSSTLGQ